VPEILKFCMRYCDPNKRKDGIEFMGRSFYQELDLLFKKRFAVRKSREDDTVDVALI
jgi:hypothetical protein